MTMGQIADRKRRRAVDILRAARELEADRGFTDMAVATVAERAGVAKGTVFLYFPTKESLGLALLEELLEEWFAAVRRSAGADHAPRALAHRLAGSVAERPALARMVALLGSVLERNVPPDVAGAFRTRLLARMRETGAALEAALPFLARGDGLQLQLFVLVVVAGLQPLAEPAEAVRSALATPELAALRLDFAGSLESALRVHLEGLRALRAPVATA